MSEAVSGRSSATTLGRVPAEVATRPPEREQSWRSVPVAVWCFLAAIAVNVFSGYSGDLGLPIGLDRVLLPMALLLMLLDPWRERMRPGLVFVCMAAFALLATASAQAHGMLTQSVPFFALVDRIYLPFVLFAASPYFLGTPLRRRLFLRTMALLGLYLSATAVLETAGAHSLVFPPYIEAVKAAMLTQRPEDIPRAGGPFVSGEANGMALAMCGFLSLLLAHLDRGLWRVMGLLVGPLALVCSVLSLTRSVWLGAALGIVVVIGSTRALWRYVPLLLTAGVVLAVAAALAFPELVSAITERGGTSRSIYDRSNTNAAALRIMADRPFTGVGWSRFVLDGWQWAQQADGYPLTNFKIEVHNVFLSRAAELGVPSAALLIACLACGPGAVLITRYTGELAAWRLAFVAIFILWGVVSMTSPNSYPFPNFLMWIVAGFLYWFRPHARSTSRTGT